jgi:hypothetical protein
MIVEKPTMDAQVAQAFKLMGDSDEHFRVGAKEADCRG